MFNTKKIATTVYIFVRKFAANINFLATVRNYKILLKLTNEGFRITYN